MKATGSCGRWQLRTGIAAVFSLRLVQKELHRQKNKEHEIASYINRLMLIFLHFQVTVVMFTYRREQPLQQFLQVHNFILSAVLG